MYQPVRVRRFTATGFAQLRIEPSGAVDRERAIAAGIAAHLRRQHALQRIGRVRGRVVERAVEPALRHLRRRTGEVDVRSCRPSRSAAPG